MSASTRSWMATTQAMTLQWHRFYSALLRSGFLGRSTSKSLLFLSFAKNRGSVRVLIPACCHQRVFSCKWGKRQNFSFHRYVHSLEFFFCYFGADEIYCVTSAPHSLLSLSLTHFFGLWCAERAHIVVHNTQPFVLSEWVVKGKKNQPAHVYKCLTFVLCCNA